MRWNHLSIPKLQRWTEKLFIANLTGHDLYTSMFMLGSKLIQVRKNGSWRSWAVICCNTGSFVVWRKYYILQNDWISLKRFYIAIPSVVHEYNPRFIRITDLVLWCCMKSLNAKMYYIYVITEAITHWIIQPSGLDHRILFRSGHPAYLSIVLSRVFPFNRVNIGVKMKHMRLCLWWH